MTPRYRLYHQQSARPSQLSDQTASRWCRPLTNGWGIFGVIIFLGHAADRRSGPLAGFIIQRASDDGPRCTAGSMVRAIATQGGERVTVHRHECITSRLGEPRSLADVCDFCSMGNLRFWLALRELPCRRNRGTLLLRHRSILWRVGSAGVCHSHRRKLLMWILP
jgi:hypothetical protein